jgi:hypothetical protein
MVAGAELPAHSWPAFFACNGALTEYAAPTSSAVFACPPGIREGDNSSFWGSTIFDRHSTAGSVRLA